MNTREFTSNDKFVPSNLQQQQQSNSIMTSTHVRHLSPKRKTGEIITQVFEAPACQMSPKRERKSSPKMKTCISPKKVYSPSKESPPQRSNSPSRLASQDQQPAAGGTFTILPVQNHNQESACTLAFESNYEPINKPLCYPNTQDAVLQPDSAAVSPGMKGYQQNQGEQQFQDKYSVSSSFIPNPFKGEDYKASQTLNTLDYSPTRQRHLQHSPVRHDWQQRIEEQLELFQSVQAQPEWHQPLQGKPLWHQNLMAQSQLNIQSDSQQYPQQQQQLLESKNSAFTRTQSLFESGQNNSPQRTSNQEEEENKDISMNYFQRAFPQEFAISLPASQINTSRSGNQSAVNSSQINYQLNQQQDGQKQELKDTIINQQITVKQTTDRPTLVTNTATAIPQHQVNSPESVLSLTPNPKMTPLIRLPSPKIPSSKSPYKVSFDLNESDESKSRNTSKSNISTVKSPQQADWIDPEAIESYLKKSFSKDQRKQLIERLSKQIQSEEDEESQSQSQSQEGWSEAQPQGNCQQQETNDSAQSLRKKTKKNLHIENSNNHQHYQLLRNASSTNGLEADSEKKKNNQKININDNLDTFPKGQDTPQWDDGCKVSAENRMSFSVNHKMTKTQENALNNECQGEDQDRNIHENKGQPSSLHKDSSSSASSHKGKESSSKLAEQVEISKESKLLLQEIYLEVQTALQKYDGKVQESYSKGNYKLNGSLVESQTSSSIPSSPLIKNYITNSVVRCNDGKLNNQTNMETLSPQLNQSNKTTNENNYINKSSASFQSRSPVTLNQPTQQLRQSISISKSEDKKADQIVKCSTKPQFDGKIDKKELIAKSSDQKNDLDTKKTKTAQQLANRQQNHQSQQVLSSTRRLSQPNVQEQSNQNPQKIHNRRSSEATTGMLNGLSKRNSESLKASVVRISKLREDQAEVAFNSRKLEIFKSLTSNKQRKNSTLQQKPMKHSNQKAAISSNCSSQTNSKQLILSSNHNTNGNTSHSRTPSGCVGGQSFGEAQKQVLDTSLSNKQRTSIVLSRFFSPKCNQQLQQSKNTLKATAAQPEEFHEFTFKKISNLKNHQSPKSFLSKQSSRAVSPAQDVARSSSIEQAVINHYNNFVDTSETSSDGNDKDILQGSTKVTPSKDQLESPNISLKESQLRLTLQMSKEKSSDQKKKIQEKRARVRQLFDEVEDKFRRGEEQLSPTLKRNSSIPVLDDRQQSNNRASCSPLSPLGNLCSDAQRDLPDKRCLMNSFSPVQQFHHSLKLKKQEIIGDIQLLERRIELEGQQSLTDHLQHKKSASQDYLENNEGIRKQSKAAESLGGQLQKKQNIVCNSDSKKSNIANVLGEQQFSRRKTSMDQLQAQQSKKDKANSVHGVNNQLKGITSPQCKGFSIIDSGQSKKKDHPASRQATPKIPLYQVKSGSDLNEADQTFLQNEEDIYSISQCHSAEYHLEMIAGSNNAANNQSASKYSSSGGKSKTTLKDSNNARTNMVATIHSNDKMDQQREKTRGKQENINQDNNNDSISRIDVENVNLYRQQQQQQPQVPQKQHLQECSTKRQPSANRMSTEGRDKREDDGVHINVYRSSQSPNGRKRFEDKDRIWMEQRKNLIAKTHKTVATTITTEEECTFSPQINHKKARTLHSPASYYPAEKNIDKALPKQKRVFPSTVHISPKIHDNYEEMHQMNAQQLPIEVEFWSQSDASVYKAINDIDNTSNQGDLKKEIADLLDIITDVKSSDHKTTTTPNKTTKGVSPARPTVLTQPFDKPKSTPSKIIPSNHSSLGEKLKNQLRTSYLTKINRQQATIVGAHTSQKKDKE